MSSGRPSSLRLAPHSDGCANGGAITLSDLARLVGGALDGDIDGNILSIARLEDATMDEVSFCALREYRGHLSGTGAAAVIVANDFEPPRDVRDKLAFIRVDNPYLAVAQVVNYFFPEDEFPPSIHPSAVIDDSAEIGEDVSVNARVVIGANCSIGARTRLGAGCVLAEDARVGSDCHLLPNVTLYPAVVIGDRVVIHAGAVVGSDGFGYATEGDKHVKIPQVGDVVIGDDVEIGANACIDRAALGTTLIADGTKIDNLVQIGHNCEVGPNSILCGQVGVSGSTQIGEGVLIGGQAGLNGHLTVGDGAMIAGGSGVTSSVPAGCQVGGYPHLEASRWRRVVAALRTLPELGRRVHRLEAMHAGEKEEEE